MKEKETTGLKVVLGVTAAGVLFLVGITAANRILATKLQEDVQRLDQSISKGDHWKQIGDAVVEHRKQINELMEGFRALQTEFKSLHEALDRIQPDDSK